MKPHLLLLLTLLVPPLRAEPFLEKQDLFTVGDDQAYNIYHIPGIVVTAQGSVLAWCEARKGGGDWSESQHPTEESSARGAGMALHLSARAARGKISASNSAVMRAKLGR